MTVEITNLKDAQTFIREVPKSLVEKVALIIRAGAMICMDKAKQVSPTVTGRYKSSIHPEVGSNPVGSYPYTAEISGEKFDGKFKENPPKDEIWVGTNVVYAGKVEQKHRPLEQGTISAQFHISTEIDKL